MSEEQKQPEQEIDSDGDTVMTEKKTIF